MIADAATPRPSMAIVGDRPMRSMATPPTANPKMLPRIETFVIHAPAVARTRVGKSSARWAPKEGVSMVAPKVARKIAGASTHPESKT